MYIEILKSKIHRGRITDTNLDYVGSITIDQDLLNLSDIIEGEKVQVVNNNNGQRFETYAIKGEKGSGIICLNGAAARKAQKGDIIIILSYIHIKKKKAHKYKPAIISLNENNKLITD